MNILWRLLLCCIAHHSLILVTCRPQFPTAPESEEHNASSEFVFSPEKEYVNAKEVEAMIHVDSRGPEVAPFESEERLWGTSPPPDGLWKKMKKAVRRLFLGDHSTTKRPWNATGEPLKRIIARKFGQWHHYLKYTVFKKPTPNATVPETTTEDPLNFWRAHYTDWAFFNRMHHEIMNASDPEQHWFYRTLMMEGYGINLEEFSTTTPMEFDIHRMDGFSTNITLPPTTPPEESDIDSAEFSPNIREMLTLRPKFVKAIDNYIANIKFPKIPKIKTQNFTSFVQGPKYKRLYQKVNSFYFMTTAATDDFMDTHEAKRNEKLKKWMVKEEKRLGQEIDKEVDGYIPDWGSDFVEFYKRAEKRHRTTQMEKEVTTENKDEVTQYMPPHVRKAFSEDRMVNVTLLDRWLYEHCSNNTIEWITTQPPTKPTFGTHSSTTERLTTLAERLRTTLYTGTTPEYFTIPKAQEEFLLSDNFTFDEAKINRMLEVAHVNLRNLSFLRVDENWRRLSQGMYEIQFTTTPTPVDSEEVLNMFTDKLNYDYNQDTK